MNEERRRDYPDIIERLKHIETLLMGNGRVGIAEMSRRSFEYYQQHRASKNGLIDWGFRIAISIILGYIALKVGLK